MKSLLFMLFLFLGSLAVKAQSQVPDIQPLLKDRSDPLRNNSKFLFNVSHVNIVRSNHKEYRADSLAFQSINKDWVSLVSLLNDSISVKKYGRNNPKGIVVITLNDQEHPEAFEYLKKKLRPL